jgi:hypothetical protein
MTRLIAPPQPQVYVHGSIRAGLIAHARTKVTAGLRHSPRPVLFVRLNLSRATARGVDLPYTVAVHADVSGVDLHATASAATITEAVALVQRGALRVLPGVHLPRPVDLRVGAAAETRRLEAQVRRTDRWR